MGTKQEHETTSKDQAVVSAQLSLIRDFTVAAKPIGEPMLEEHVTQDRSVGWVIEGTRWTTDHEGFRIETTSRTLKTWNPLQESKTDINALNIYFEDKNILSARKDGMPEIKIIGSSNGDDNEHGRLQNTKGKPELYWTIVWGNIPEPLTKIRLPKTS